MNNMDREIIISMLTDCKGTVNSAITAISNEGSAVELLPLILSIITEANIITRASERIAKEELLSNKAFEWIVSEDKIKKINEKGR